MLTEAHLITFPRYIVSVYSCWSFSSETSRGMWFVIHLLSQAFGREESKWVENGHCLGLIEQRQQDPDL